MQTNSTTTGRGHGERVLCSTISPWFQQQLQLEGDQPTQLKKDVLSQRLINFIRLSKSTFYFFFLITRPFFLDYKGLAGEREANWNVVKYASFFCIRYRSIVSSLHRGVGGDGIWYSVPCRTQPNGRVNEVVQKVYIIKFMTDKYCSAAWWVRSVVARFPSTAQRLKSACTWIGSSFVCWLDQSQDKNSSNIISWSQ